MGRYNDSGLADGVGPGRQTSIFQDTYAVAVKEAEKHLAEIIEREALIQELEDANVKFTKEDIVFIIRDPTGQIVWLEKGNSSVGLKHILARHAKHFEKKYGIQSSDIPSYIQEVVRSGKMISNTVSVRKGRETIQKIYEYQGERYLLIAQGTNGFIVSAYPVKRPKE